MTRTLTPAEQAENRRSNMHSLRLNDAQYDEWTTLMGQKMTEWPDSLWQYVYRVQRRYGLCGEVIAESVADWLRGDNDHGPERAEDV